MLTQFVGKDLEESSIYRTEPWGEKDQSYFLNQVIVIDSDIEPNDMMNTIERIEKLLGKRKETRYGPRTIDIDVLLCDDQIIDNKNLIVPHPRMHKRAFTLIPLAEISDSILHPKLDKTIAELLVECGDTSEVSKVQ